MSMTESHPEIFINHALEDNKAIDNKPGWVESFSYVVKLMTGQILHHNLNIALREEYPSEKLDNDLIKDVKAFVNVYSDSFPKDEKAKLIRDAFLSSNSEDKTLFSVLKNPMTENEHSGNTYEFYSAEESQNQESWDPELDSEHSKDYWLKVVDLSYDIAKAIKNEKRNQSKSVFLAEVNPDQRAVRDAIKRDLIRHGYTVLPNKPLAKDKLSIEKQITECLSDASLAIHLLSDSYGSKTLLKDLSLVDYQNKVASQFCKTNSEKLTRIIWLPSDHKYVDLDQNEYLEGLRQNKEELYNAELIQTPVEILKSIILKRLDKQKYKSDSKAKKDTKEIQNIEKGGIYIVHDANDSKDIKPILDWFEKNNIKVLRPDFELQHFKMMLDHKNKLVAADSVLIYCNHGNQQWSKTKIKDIVKSPGFGRNRPFEFKALYLASKHNLDLKEQVDEEDFLILENTNQFSASLMSGLFSKVK